MWLKWQTSWRWMCLCWLPALKTHWLIPRYAIPVCTSNINLNIKQFLTRCRDKWLYPCYVSYTGILQTNSDPFWNGDSMPEVWNMKQQYYWFFLFFNATSFYIHWNIGITYWWKRNIGITYWWKSCGYLDGVTDYYSNSTKTPSRLNH